MTTLAADIAADQKYLPQVVEPGFYTIDDESVRVTSDMALTPSARGGGQFDPVGNVIVRAIGGTMAAAHLSGATLTRYYPDAPGGGGIPQGGPLTAPLDVGAQPLSNFGGGGIAVFAQEDDPTEGPNADLVTNGTLWIVLDGSGEPTHIRKRIGDNSDWMDLLGSYNAFGPVTINSDGSNIAHFANDGAGGGGQSLTGGTSVEHVLYDSDGETYLAGIRGDADGTRLVGTKHGFFGGATVAQPVIPLTVPTTQDVIDALVALGLVSQSD